MDPVTGAALLKTGGDLIGGFMNQQATRAANKEQKRQYYNGLKWQEQMDSTKYQRMVTDLQAAGLNPMLATGKTATSPSATTAPTVKPEAFDLKALDKLNYLEKTLQMDATRETVNNSKSQQVLNSSLTDKAKEEKRAQKIQNDIAEKNLQFYDKWKTSPAVLQFGNDAIRNISLGLGIYTGLKGGRPRPLEQNKPQIKSNYKRPLYDTSGKEIGNIKWSN